MSVEKGPDAFRTISEVAEDLDLPQHVLRFWETRFPQIRPLKRGGGRRYYRPDDIELLRGIRHLLYTEGYTIRGVQRILKDEGPRYVQAIWRDAEAEAAEIDAYEERERRPAPREAGPREPAGRGAREDVDAGHPGRGDGPRAEGRGGALSGLLNLLPSRQRATAPREAAERGSFDRDAFDGDGFKDDSFEPDPLERGPGPSLPREPQMREPQMREPSLRDPEFRDPLLREPPIRGTLPREGAPRDELGRDQIGREPSGREPSEPPRLFADEPPPARRGGRRRAESEPDFLELPLLPDLAPQSRPPRAEPGRREAEAGARYIGPLDAPGTEAGPESFAPRRSEPQPRPGGAAEPRASFPFRAVTPEPEIDEAIAFAQRPEARPPHILARQNSRPMPVATPAPAPAPVAAPIPPTPVVPPRSAEEAASPAPAAALAREDVQRLQAALYELQECRRILDAARN